MNTDLNQTNGGPVSASEFGKSEVAADAPNMIEVSRIVKKYGDFTADTLRTNYATEIENWG